MPKKLLIPAEIFLAVAFAIARGFPNNPPVFIDWFELILLAAFVLVFGINIWTIVKEIKTRKYWWTWTTLAILVVVFVAAMMAGDPIRKTHQEAIAYTKQQQQAAEVGYDLGVDLASGEKTEAEIIKEIKRLPPQVQEVANKAIVDVIESNNNSSKPEVVSKTVPTIPVQIGSWTCILEGCSFADSNHIWTISMFDLVMAAFLNGVIMLMGTWILNSNKSQRKSR
jgi:hypothetical protein